MKRSDVEPVARLLGVDLATVYAIIEVETSGVGFGPSGQPIILFEPHVFYRRLSGAERERAVQEGLAYPKQGMKPYPKSQASRYEQLGRAIEINEVAALESCSWGLGQIMGYNYLMAGFSTVYDFVAACRKSEAAQLMAMGRFILASDLEGALRERNWAAFARKYNGPGFEKNRYDSKLQEAYERNLVTLSQKEKTSMASQSPPWPPEMDKMAEEFGKKLTEKYGGRVDYLGWVRWSSDFRLLIGNGNDENTAWSLIERNIDLIRSGQPEQPYPPGQYDVPWPPSMDEEANWFGPKLEAFYADPGNRAIDVLGWVRWSSDYRVHRANGIPQDRAWTRVENDIRRIWGLPVILPPPGPFPTRSGNVVVDGRGLKDDGGRFLAVGYTQMHGAAECAKDRTAYIEDNNLLHDNGITYLRQIAMLDGGSISPDPWIWGAPEDPNNDKGAGNTSLDRFIDAVNVAYDESGLRTFVTFWGGLKNWNTQEKRKTALQSLLPRLATIKHKTIGGEITNENWMNWTGFATYTDMRELAQMVRSAMGPGWPLAMSAPSGVADDFSTDINAQFAEIRDMYYQNPAVNLTTFHFSRNVDKVDKIWRVYRQPWDNRIMVPAPDERQNVAAFLGLPPGTQLTTDASSDNEPIGVNSSGEQDDNPDRIVLGIVLAFVAGCGMRVLHDDHGVWRDWIYPDYKRPDRGATARVANVKNISLILSGIQGMIRLLPGDLPSWPRTRHGDAPFQHPFSPSFQRRDNVFTQIWPDGVTNYGVVRAYCSVKGNDFVCPLLGVKDHFDLIPAHNMKLVLIRPGGWEVMETLQLAAGQKHVVTYPEVVAIGQYI